MTRIALFLTAIPLAVALATLLNLLLDRRLAAATRPVRRRSGSKPRHLLPLALVGLLAAAPTLAATTDDTPPADRAPVDDALQVDAKRVERLWSHARKGVVLVDQSPVPVSIDTLAVSPARDRAAADAVPGPAATPEPAATPGER